MKKALSIAIGFLLSCSILFGQAPTITTFSPATGAVGTVVTITGTNLSSPTAVSIGGQSAVVISYTGSKLVGMVMPGAVTGGISVTTGGGAANGGTFTVTATNFPSAQQGDKLVGTGDIPSADQGYSVAISADGNTAIVGGEGDNGYQGAVWIYIRSGGAWIQQGPKLVGTGGAVEPEQGTSVSLSADGNTAMVGGQFDNNSTGAIWFFVRSNGVWAQQGQKFTGTVDPTRASGLGCSVSLSADGNTAIAGADGDSGPGAAWIYTRSGGAWTQGQKLIGTGSVGTFPYEGRAVAMSADGNTAIVGGYEDNSGIGAVWIYTRSGNTWTQQGLKLVGTAGVGTLVGQGYSVAISADGNTVMAGGEYDNSGLGAVWVYTRSGGAWTQQGQKLVGGGPVVAEYQGSSVSLSADGNSAIVGAGTAGASIGGSWVYTRAGGSWMQRGPMLVGTGVVGTFAAQGESVSLSADGSTAFVGGSEDNAFHGAAWVFKSVKAPTISYPTPQVFTVGQTIVPFEPTASGVAAQGYSSSAITIANYYQNPMGVALDAAGDIFVASQANKGVIETPAGTTTPMYVGGPAFSQPWGIATDAAGNVYVADYGDNTVKKITISTNVTTTVVSGLNHPYDVAVDAQGNIYVADSGNNAVKEILAADGSIITLGAGFVAPTGVAVDAYGNVYVADQGNNAIKKIPAGNGTPVTVGYGFSSPYKVTVDGSGNLFVTDFGNNTVKEIPADGGPIQVLGSGYNALYGITVDAANNVLVTDYGINALKEISPTGGIYVSPQLPAGLSIDNTFGTINGTPTAISPATNYIVTAYNSGGATSAAVNIAVNLPAVTLSYSSPHVYGVGTVINPLIPASANVYPAAYSGIKNIVTSAAVHPLGIAVDPSGNVFIGNSGFTTLTEMPAGGGPPMVYGSGLSSPVGVATDAAGNVYVADYGNHAVKKIPSGGGTPVSLGSGFSEPYGVAVDGAGNVYVADRASSTVQKIPAGGGAQVALGSGFVTPSGVAVDASGNVYVADAGNNAVKEIPAGGGTVVTLGSGFVNPSGVAVDPSGNIFIADTGNGRVVELPAGGSQVVIGSSFSSNTGVVIDPYGVVFMTDQLNNEVYSIKPSGGYYVNTNLPASLKFSNATGIVSGTATATGAAKNYIITAYNLTGSASATTSIAVTAQAVLSSFKISSGILTPYFSTGTTSYTANVVNGVAAMTVTPVAADPQATIKVNGVAVTSGSASQSLPLAGGPNTITTKVTSRDGETVKTYTLVVTRAPSTNANLSVFKISRGTLTPAFSATTTSYTASVANGVASMTVTPTTAGPGATITVNGATVASGTVSGPIVLAAGANNITVVVTAQDGVSKKTYTLVVTEAKSSNANLLSLKPGTGAISPVFSASTIAYTESVANSVTSITITPATVVTTSTVKVRGTAVTSGTASAPIPLSVGANTIKTIVTAQDGVTTKTYTLTVTRAAASADSFVPGISVTKPTEPPTLNEDGMLVHQGISPNGDGVNDFLVIDGIQACPDNNLSIMNRNGQLIYEAKGYDNSSKVFDGHSNKNGQMQLPGTYFYQLDYTVKGIAKHKTGFIVLKY